MRRARRIAVASCCLAALAATGCSFSTAPPDNVEFATIEDLHQLDGRYRNRGVVDPAEQYTMFLSALIFRPGTTLDHQSIDVVDVRAIDDTTLVARALDADGAVVEERTFVKGEDFELHSGRLRIRRGSISRPTFEQPDNPFVGAVTETIELGIDLRGAGKYRSSTAFAGLAFLLVPVAAHGHEEIRFERIEK